MSDPQHQVAEHLERLLRDHDPAKVSTEELLGAQFDLGLAWVHFPVGRGGLDAPPALQAEVDQAVVAAGGVRAYHRNPIGHGMVAPTLVAHGSDDLCARHLRPLFTAEEFWCQLFSEPGAGSDLASLATTAVADGDEWVVDGQKVWTTLAHFARFGLLLARTDPDQPKHRGITAFVVDMQAPGVEVRPLRQMTGEAEFNEVFLTGVRIPDANRIGGVGEGWHAAITTLMNERVSIGGGVPARGTGVIEDAVQAWAAAPAHLRTAERRDRLVRVWIEAEVLRLTNARADALREVGTPGPEGSVPKAMVSEMNQRATELAVELLGAEGMLFTTYEMTRPSASMSWDCPQKGFLRMRAQTIEGGSAEVLRNVLGERVLGLPGDVRVDKDLPWREVPRS